MLRSGRAGMSASAERQGWLPSREPQASRLVLIGGARFLGTGVSLVPLRGIGKWRGEVCHRKKSPSNSTNLFKIR
jgi:hypothetical protein